MGWRTLLERRQPAITDSDSRAADRFRNTGRFAVHLFDTPANAAADDAERYRAVSGWRGHCSQSKTGKAFN